ncbi:MAG TPA: hypothetical protein VGG76_07970 [Gemmatimonadaceae bacterium]
MDRVNSRIAQAYGYAVCFITVITMLIGIKAVVDSAFDLSDPIHAEGGGMGRMGRPLTSFDLYKLEARRAEVRPGLNGPARAAGDSTSDADLRKLYDAERDQLIGNAKFNAIRSLVGNLLMIVVAAVLFFIHWRWLRERDAAPAPA